MQADCSIKSIETVMTNGMQTAKIPSERSKRSKSMFVWYDDEKEKIKLEIGSTVRPDPYAQRALKTYIQEYLENKGITEAISRFSLHEVRLNVIGIERTFIDKIMSVKRHAISFYMNRRNISKEYNPLGAYGFDKWRNCFDGPVRTNYEHLHDNLLYSDEKQSLDKAISVFTEVDRIMREIGE